MTVKAVFIHHMKKMQTDNDLSINISILLVIMLKITPDCQQQVGWGVAYFLITKKSQIFIQKRQRAYTFKI